jgi:hypothetical protein
MLMSRRAKGLRRDLAIGVEVAHLTRDAGSSQQQADVADALAQHDGVQADAHGQASAAAATASTRGCARPH